ncbi:MAG: ParA family protein [Acidobacteria bacterium]|nr:ParA family protein [Acidobacteriota bacterium]
MKIVSLFSVKGGVGKTAAAVNLAFFASRRGHRTLLVDLDPQSSAGYYFRVRPSPEARGKSLLKGEKTVADLIRESDFDGLDILPAPLGLRNIDRHLAGEDRKRQRLMPVFESFKDAYDRVIVDCPPHFGLLSENVFHFSHTLLVPVVPSVLSMRTLRQLHDFFMQREYAAQKIRAFFSMVDMRKRLHWETVQSADRKKYAFLDTSIPNASEVERMGLERKPLLAYNARSKAGMAFIHLGHELEVRGCL